MPKENKAVLVCDKCGTHEIAWHKGKWWWKGFSHADCIDESRVVAWMPLPEPYRPEALREAGAEAGQDAAEQVLQSAT